MYFSSRFPRETGFPLVSGSDVWDGWDDKVKEKVKWVWKPVQVGQIGFHLAPVFLVPLYSYRPRPLMFPLPWLTPCPLSSAPCVKPGSTPCPLPLAPCDKPGSTPCPLPPAPCVKPGSTPCPLPPAPCVKPGSTPWPRRSPPVPDPGTALHGGPQTRVLGGRD